MDSKKPVSIKESNSKSDTRYYDELFTRIREDEEFKDAESFDILCSNIIEQINESDVELRRCLNSYHIDYFLYKLPLEKFTSVFSILSSSTERIDELLGDSRSARAYDACLLLTGEKVKGSTDCDDLKLCVSRLGDYFVDNFDSILDSSKSGIFAMRSFLKVIGKKDLVEGSSNNNNANQKGGKKSAKEVFSMKNYDYKVLPDDWNVKEYLKKFYKKIKDKNVLELGLGASVSPFVALLTRKLSTSYEDLSLKYIKSIHSQFTKKPNSFASMLQDAVGSRFIEAFLYASTGDILKHYLDSFLVPNCVAYTRHIYANYPIQTLLKFKIDSEPQIETLFDALVENLASIIDVHTDLIFKNYLIIELIDACQRVRHLKFENLMKSLLNFFGCGDKENNVHFLKVLLVYEKLDEIAKEGPVDQALYLFDLKPIASSIATKLFEMDEKTVKKGFAALNANELEYLCTNNVGSHFIQNCLKLSESKDRSVWLQSVFDRLKGRLMILATNRNGSFVMETLWSVGNLKQRLSIVDELKPSEVQLKNDQYARFLVNKVGLNFYKRKPEEWKSIQANELKKRKMFSDLLDDDDDSGKSNSNADNCTTKKKKIN